MNAVPVDGVNIEPGIIQNGFVLQALFCPCRKVLAG